jgi:hypothetical protein
VLAAPLEDVGAIEAPDGHAGGGDVVGGAQVRARLPAVGDARRRILEEDHELVEQREGLAVRVFGGLQAVVEGFEAGDWGERGCVHAD